VTADIAPVPRRLVQIGGGLLAFAFGAFVLHAAIGFGGSGTATLFDTWVYDLLMAGAAASCFLRAALIRRERLAWVLLGLGLAFWTGGEIYYEVATATAGSIPTPSPADAGYLLLYPFAYAGLIVLLRERIGSFPAARWLDGLVAGTAAAAVAAAVALGPIVDYSTSGSTAEVATNLAYPIGDLTLLTLVVTAAAFTGWRPGAGWTALGLGLVVLAGTDFVYLLQSAQGNYVEGSLLNAGWPAGALLLAGAAWLAPGRRRAAGGRDARVAAVPAVAALAAIGVQGAERFTRVPPAAEALSLVTLVLVVIRLGLAFRESQANLELTTHEALTDPLTGLANRRALMDDLEAAVAAPAAPGHLRLLVIFDLDGFKAYNDAYGHPAGDSLLARLGGRLEAFAGAGAAYRLGGDEFCLLTECTAAAVDGLVGGAGAALSERGEGFHVTASQGSVLIPSEARTREGALQLADRRMYANKSRERASAGSQSRDVLLTALRERRPELAAHLADTAALSLAVAEELGMDPEQRDEVRRAAELHDTGKVAIPDAILNKPGPLDDAEWAFMRRHTLIGERIIASAAALVPVARLVRSTHERWDGKGYPDQLAGEQIPLGSRIVAVCDAYEAMTSERPYSVAMLPERALEELRQGAGSQFDAGVVAAFERVAAARRAVRS
jgi:two-component system cell cycle response regulator